MVKSFFSTMQRALFNTRATWASRQELANAIFEWLEAWYNPKRRHTSIGSISPINYENQHHPHPTEEAA